MGECGYYIVGSPPPMRGKVPLQNRKELAVRITPAYAGKRWNCQRRKTNFWDHPRLCGEKPTAALIAYSVIGSPPPMRGKVCNWVEIPVDFGITPAYAGKRLSSARYMRYRQDHPRLCGEKSGTWKCMPFVTGSPPPMRGKGRGGRLHIQGRGITPAYAGKRQR